MKVFWDPGDVTMGRWAVYPTQPNNRVMIVYLESGVAEEGKRWGLVTASGKVMQTLTTRDHLAAILSRAGYVPVVMTEGRA